MNAKFIIFPSPVPELGEDQRVGQGEKTHSWLSTLFLGDSDDLHAMIPGGSLEEPRDTVFARELDYVLKTQAFFLYLPLKLSSLRSESQRSDLSYA